MLITEEALVSSSAIWHSPDGRYLAFASFDDTRVKDIEYSYYGAPGSLEEQYPITVKIKYPKVRDPYSVINIIQWIFRAGVIASLLGGIYYCRDDIEGRPSV